MEGGLPAIVSEDTYYLAQREVKKRQVGKQPRMPKAEYLLSGKLFCGHCGAAMAGVSGTGKQGDTYYYYCCPEARAKRGCAKKHVRREWIESFVVERTVEYVLRPDMLPKIAHKVFEAQENDVAAAELAALDSHKRENQKKQTNIINAIEAGAFSAALQIRLKSLEEEAEAIKSEIAYQRALDVKFTEEQIEFMLLDYAQPPDDDDWDAYKQRIIRCFVCAVYLHDDKLLVYYNFTKDGKDLDFTEIGDFDEQSVNSTKQQRPVNQLTLDLQGVVLADGPAASRAMCSSAGSWT